MTYPYLQVDHSSAINIIDVLTYHSLTTRQGCPPRIQPKLFELAPSQGPELLPPCFQLLALQSRGEINAQPDVCCCPKSLLALADQWWAAVQTWLALLSSTAMEDGGRYSMKIAAANLPLGPLTY